MEHFIPDETTITNVNGVIDRVCVSKKLEPTELELDSESDVADTVEMLKAIMATDGNATAKLNAGEAVGVHSQIVGELTHRRRVWVYTELCESTIMTQWKPLEESNSSKDLDTLIVSRRAPRLVTLISNFLIKELAAFAPNKRVLLGSSSNNSRTQTANASRTTSNGQRNVKTNGTRENGQNRSQRAERGRGKNSRGGRAPRARNVCQKIGESSSSTGTVMTRTGKEKERSAPGRGGGGANRPAAKATFAVDSQLDRPKLSVSEQQ